MRELQNPAEAEPEEEEVEAAISAAESLCPDAPARTVSKSLSAPLQPQPVLDPFRECLGIAVEVARVTSSSGSSGEEEVRGQQDRVELPVGGLVAPTHPIVAPLRDAGSWFSIQSRPRS